MNEPGNNKERLGMKLGWLLGGIGSILWIPILAVVMISEREIFGGVLALLLTIGAACYIFMVTPWRFPRRSMGLLYLGLGAILALAAVVVLMMFPDEPQLPRAHRLWFLFCLLPALTPVFTLSGKTWSGLSGQDDTADPEN